MDGEREVCVCVYVCVMCDIEALYSYLFARCGAYCQGSVSNYNTLPVDPSSRPCPIIVILHVSTAEQSLLALLVDGLLLGITCSVILLREKDRTWLMPSRVS